MRELTAEQVLALDPEELLAVWPDAAGERLDAVVAAARAARRLPLRRRGRRRRPARPGSPTATAARAGEWWHDLVAEAAGPELDGALARPGALRVRRARRARPTCAARGIGGRLHDALLGGLDAPTAVLSTERSNEPALALYRGRGWQVVLPEIDFGPAYEPFCVLGLDLRG